VSNLISAVEIMEQGLATVFQQMLQLKSDVDYLPPAQAKLFKRLSSQLYTKTFTDLMKIVNDRNDLLQKIRTQPGLEYFLLPKSYHALCQASHGGPIVILNSHKYHCDGIIILNPISEPVHVALPNVTIDFVKSQRTMLKQLLGRCNVRNRGESEATRLFGQREQFSSKTSEECFADLLSWLWNYVVHPVYAVLEVVRNCCTSTVRN
jgi:hypothetical protein